MSVVPVINFFCKGMKYNFRSCSGYPPPQPLDGCIRTFCGPSLSDFTCFLCDTVGKSSKPVPNHALYGIANLTSVRIPLDGEPAVGVAIGHRQRLCAAISRTEYASVTHRICIGETRRITAAISESLQGPKYVAGFRSFRVCRRQT